MKVRGFQCLAVVLLLATGVGWYALHEEDAAEPVVAVPSPIRVEEGETLKSDADQAEVFRRAFWRHPTEDDEILHAERREWSDDAGVTRWQWFLEVTPSAELSAHLFERNAFQLSKPEGVVAPPRERPAWFPKRSHEFEIQQSRGGEMTLLVDPTTGTLFATGRGGGFVRGAKAPEEPATVVQAERKGRLPNSSPPAPPIR